MSNLRRYDPKRAWFPIALWTLAACSDTPPAQLPKGLVLIVVDTLRADALLAEDGSLRHPALRELAADAAVFEECYSHASLTWPSHAALFSSRLPSEAGVVGNHDALPAGVPTLAEWLSQHGFQAQAVTSFNLQGGTGRPGGGLMRGFERVSRPHEQLRWAEETMPRVRVALQQLDGERPFFLFFHFVDPHYPYRDHGGAPLGVEVWNGDEPLRAFSASQTTYEQEHVKLPPGARRIAFRGERAFTLLHFDARNRDLGPVPWRFEQGGFEQLATEHVAALENPGQDELDVKLSFAVYDEPGVAESRTRYAGEVAHVDAFLGQIFAALAQQGLYEESVVLVTSDHGEALGEHGTLQHSDNLFDELLHVPLILKPPASNPGLLHALRARRGELVGLIDIVPTLLEIFALPALPGQRGSSILGARSGLVFAEGHPPYADQLQVCVRDERYKMIFHPEEERFFLFDLSSDPDEEHDLFGQGPAPRPDWPELLRRKAAELASPAPLEDVDPRRLRELKALGYLGDEDEEAALSR